MADVYPSFYYAASQASKDGQSLYTRLLGSNLVLVVCAAVVGIVGSRVQQSGIWWLLIVVLIAAVGMRVVSRQRHPERDWFDGRAVAESIKTASWRFMMCADPFDAEDSAADLMFVGRLKEIFGERKSLRLALVAADAKAITTEMRRVRSLSWERRREIYLADRIRDQVGWYTDKAATARRRSHQWSVGGLLTELTAIVAAATLVWFPEVPNVIGALSSLGAAATAWTQLRRHDDLAQSYDLAARELRLAEALVDSTRDPASFVAAVADAEKNISREHTLWAIKRGAA